MGLKNCVYYEDPDASNEMKNFGGFHIIDKRLVISAAHYTAKVSMIRQYRRQTNQRGTTHS